MTSLLSVMEPLLDYLDHPTCLRLAATSKVMQAVLESQPASFREQKRKEFVAQAFETSQRGVSIVLGSRQPPTLELDGDLLLARGSSEVRRVRRRLNFSTQGQLYNLRDIPGNVTVEVPFVRTGAWWQRARAFFFKLELFLSFWYRYAKEEGASSR